MVNLINQAFQNTKNQKRPALITYTVAGDYTKNKSLEILESISEYVDICEIGFPHNTPIGDGGQIQTSSNRAIKNGFKMRDSFQIVNKFKKNFKQNPVQCPINLPPIKTTFWGKKNDGKKIIEIIAIPLKKKTENK